VAEFTEDLRAEVIQLSQQYEKLYNHIAESRSKILDDNFISSSPGNTEDASSSSSSSSS